ncbi:Fic family protein [Methanococcoides methylutens]|uniref:Huntingtin interacting protein E-like protein n=1 Tax=Methanococcoides methylutens MM1 TaxID=1434104 RepID=A0A0E3SQT7_METMT|nr:Fic family protein [Methanococcoides methylutens]AKB85116.1 Huntingtin interacting protein E-like protein [Methanococcoides methylutens MM1]
MANTDISLINKELLFHIEEKVDLINSMRPLSVDTLSRLHDEIKVMHTYHSNAIEGNTLTLSETKLVLEEGITIGGKSLREHLEASNNAKAFDLIEDLARENKAIDHMLVQQVHEIVTKNILEDAGRYRTKNVRITGAVKTPPDWSKIIKMLDELFNKVNSSKDSIIETSTLLHHGFVEIHPFIDGNGRVARLLTNLYLMGNRYPPIILKKEDRLKYYKALRSADAGNLKPFANFIAKAVDASLSSYLSIYGGKDELVPLKDLVPLTPYSQEYLSLRARQGSLDAVKTGNIWLSSQNSIEKYMREHAQKRKKEELN